MKGWLAPHRGFLAASALIIGAGLCPWRVGAAIIVVTTNADSGNGSLRQAIQFNASVGGGNTISFSDTVTSPIVFTSGELVISNDVTIVGPGAKELSVSGNMSSRVFHLVGNANASISGLSIVRGYRGALPGGAGILQDSGTLTLAQCNLATNYVVLNSVSANGGGAISQAAGTLTLSNCTISACYVEYGTGGGICQNGGALTLLNSTVTGNSYYGIVGAGGIHVNAGTLAMTNCTISGNLDSAGALSGGGIYNAGGTVTVRNTIIAGNSANTYLDCAGVFASAGYNLVGASNESFGWGSLGDQVGTTNSPINPLLGPLQDNRGPTFTMAPLSNSPAVDRGSSGGMATDQRGRTRPYTNNYVSSIPFGGDRTDIGAVEISPATLVVSNTNDHGDGSLRQTILDASSVESDTIRFASNVVGAIQLSSGELGISKSLTISGPGAKNLAVSGSDLRPVFVVLDGRVAISALTISDGRLVGTTGAFEQTGAEARGGGIFNQATLALNDCIISSNSVVGGQGGETDSGFAGTGGNGLGGGIANIGTLAMTNCLLVTNSATGGNGGTATGAGSEGGRGQGYGGGLYSSGPLTLVRSTLAGNSANGASSGEGTGSGYGGGLDNEADVTMLTCTVVSNSAGGSTFDFGGGIYHNGTTLTVRSATIWGNQADYGGGILAYGAADLGNTILAGNTANSGPEGNGTINSSDYNLVQNTSDLTLTGTTTHNITGQSPLLGPLRDNGGPTPTMALLPGSPALDKGKNFGLMTDQRGAARPFEFVSVANADGGDGTDIGAFELNPPMLSIARSGANSVLSWSTFGAGFRLEAATNLPAAGNWTIVNGTPLASGNQLFATNSTTAVRTLYRLVYP